MKSNDYFILLLNKCNIVTYKNSINNDNGDKDSGSDNNNFNGNDSYNVNKIRVIV